MQFKTSKDTFLKAISAVLGAINPKANLPILANVLVQSNGPDELKLTATDLEIGILTSCPARITEEGAVTIPAKKLHDIIRELPPEEVEVTVAKNFAVNIKTNKSFFKIMGLEPDEFPKLPEPTPEHSFKLEQRILKQCLALVVFAISRDDARYTLNGALLISKNNSLRFVATDGKRLASIKKDIELPKNTNIEVIIPAKTIAELLKTLTDESTEVGIAYAQNQMVFQCGETTITSRLIEGKFPNYEQVIPKGEKNKNTNYKTRSPFCNQAGFASHITRKPVCKI